MTTEVMTIDHLFKYYYSNAFYHRDYIWDENQQVLKLFQDMTQGFYKKDNNIFNGIIMLNHQLFDNYIVIDGLQRLVTYLLLLIVFKEYLENVRNQSKVIVLLEDINHYLSISNKPRIKFHHIVDNEFMEALIKGETYTGYLSMMSNKILQAFHLLKQEFDLNLTEENKCDFIMYIFSKVQVLVIKYQNLTLNSMVNIYQRTNTQEYLRVL